MDSTRIGKTYIEESYRMLRKWNENHPYNIVGYHNPKEIVEAYTDHRTYYFAEQVWKLGVDAGRWVVNPILH